jgi:ankyrin repeat protein
VTETKDGLGFTALHAACAGGFLSTVDALLKHNFSVDSNDNNAGLSPLFFAVNGGFCLLVERLLPLVANESSLYDARGRSLLLFLPSDENAALAISTMMLSTFPFIDGDAESDLVSQHIEHTRFRVQSAALHISNIDPTSLSNLLNDLPCLIYCRMNGEGCTLLHMACEQLEAFMCVEVLCRMGAPVEAVMSNGVSPLHVAAVSKNLTAMSTLLSYGGSPDLPDHNDLTPLQIAVASSFSAGIELLVKEWHAYSMNADTTCSTADRIDDCFKNFPQTATCAGVLGEHISDKRACKVTDTIIDKIDVSNQSNLSINNGLFLSQNLTLICRICSTPAYHSDISGWLTCSTKTCCDSYTVCASCINILKENDLSPETSIPKSISKPAACDGNVSFKRGKSSIYATKNERAFDKKVRSRNTMESTSSNSIF